MEEFINLPINDKFIEEAIMQEVYIQTGYKTTICVLILNTGFEVIGIFTGSVSPIDIKEGKEKARKDAWAKAEQYFIQLDSWRLAIYNSEKAIQEQQQAKADGLKTDAEANKSTPTPENTQS